MDYKIEAGPEFSFLSVNMNPGEKILVEASSMASMDTTVQMKTRLKGGFKRFLARESLFINEFTAQGANSEICIAPGLTGEISHEKITPGEKFYLTSSCFLACSEGVSYNTKWQGMSKGFFSGESFFLMEMTGEGDLWYNYYGGIFAVDVVDEYVVDTGHIVGFTEGLDYSISKVGGYKSLFFSGEGFVARFRGQGKVYIQTKSSTGLISWADRYRIVVRNNN
jgi:uncharacterized protein (TIGR00266 family)